MVGADNTRRPGMASMLFGRIDARAARPAQAVAPVEQAARLAMLEEAANIFKTLGHEGRLLILCHLAQGEKTVNELEGILDARQSAVSQQLARLRMEGLVTARRDGKTICYSLKDPRIGELLRCYGRIFAGDGTPAP